VVKGTFLASRRLLRFRARVEETPTPMADTTAPAADTPGRGALRPGVSAVSVVLSAVPAHHRVAIRLG
jgi:hypothetical protein